MERKKQPPPIWEKFGGGGCIYNIWKWSYFWTPNVYFLVVKHHSKQTQNTHFPLTVALLFVQCRWKHKISKKKYSNLKCKNSKKDHFLSKKWKKRFFSVFFYFWCLLSKVKLQFQNFEKTLFRRENSCSKHVFCEIFMSLDAFLKGKVTLLRFCDFLIFAIVSAKSHRNMCFLTKIVCFLTLCVFLVPEQCFRFWPKEQTSCKNL